MIKYHHHLSSCCCLTSAQDDIIILSERADELQCTTETSVHQIACFDLNNHVHYYKGNPRNLNHLKACAVMTARVVAIFHQPIPTIISVEVDDDDYDQCHHSSGQQEASSSKLNVDRHIVIISLNLSS